MNLLRGAKTMALPDKAPLPGGIDGAHAVKFGETSEPNYSLFVWECEPCNFTWDYHEDETCIFLAGEVTLCRILREGEKKPTALAFTVEAGDIVHFNKGESVIWNVHVTVRKVAVFVESPGFVMRNVQRVMRLAKRGAVAAFVLSLASYAIYRVAVGFYS